MDNSKRNNRPTAPQRRRKPPTLPNGKPTLVTEGHILFEAGDLIAGRRCVAVPNDKAVKADKALRAAGYQFTIRNRGEWTTFLVWDDENVVLQRSIKAPIREVQVDVSNINHLYKGPQR